MKTMFILIVIGLSLGACTPHQERSTLTGAGVGAAVGGLTTNSVRGAAVGGLLGGVAGNEMAKRDLRKR